MEIKIFALFGTLGVILTVTYRFLQMKWKIENLKKENKILKKERNEQLKEYPGRRLEKIRELFGTATEEICILGVMVLRPIQRSKDLIINFVNKHNGKVRILISDPNSKFFKHCMKREKDKAGRLSLEHKQTVIVLKTLLEGVQQKKRDNVMVKKYQNVPEEVSLQIVDNNEMYVNEYPPERGRRRSRGVMYKVCKKRKAHRKTFEHFKKLFEDIWIARSTKEM